MNNRLCVNLWELAVCMRFVLMEAITPFPLTLKTVYLPSLFQHNTVRFSDTVQYVHYYLSIPLRTFLFFILFYKMGCQSPAHPK